MIFGVLEDRRGYIWLATNHGAVCYDGHAFRTYTTRDGLVNNTILSICEDAQGRLWFLSLSKQLCYFDAGHIYQCRANSLLEGVFPYEPSKLYVGSNGTVWISMLGDNSLYEIRDNTVTKVNWTHELSGSSANYHCRLIGNRWMTLQKGRGKENRIIDFGKDWYRLEIQQTDQERGEDIYSSQRLRNGTIIAVSSYRLIVFDRAGKGRIARTSPDKSFNSVIEDSHGDLWLLTRNGAYRYPGGIIDGSEPQLYLPGTFITGVFCDRAGNYWLSSWDNGLYCMPGMGFQTLRVSNSPIENAFTAIKVYDNRIWFINTRGNIFNIDNNSFPTLFLDGQKVLAPAPESIDFLRDDRGRIWVGQLLRVLSPGPRNSYLSRHIPVSSAKALQPLRDGRIAVGTAQGFTIVSKNFALYSAASFLSYTERTNAIYEQSDGSIWLGAISGLYRYKGTRIRNYGKTYPLLQNRIVAIAERSNGDLILGTQGVGVIVMRNDGRELYRIDADSGLASDIVRTLFVENDSVIWAGTNKGLSRITVRNDRLFAYDVINYTTVKGLPSNGINGIAKHHGLIWLATDDGVCRFNPDSVGKNHRPLPIEITEVAVNGTPITPTGSCRLPYDRNNVTISFIGIGFRTAGDIRYRYRLSGLGQDTVWHETANRAIPFFALPPGSYLFQVSAMNEDGVWNPEPRETRFEIVPHFTQTFWFRLGVVVFILSGGILIVWRMLERRRRAYAIDAQIRELRQQALSANMNPHFFSNSMSVVQDYVLRHNAYEANEFLARFSRLIRLNMETSLRSFVPLQEELERLEIYLSLERLRFGDALEYVIRVDDGIDTDETLIPSMLMQPYVENAIWHGILPAGRPGLVEILIKSLNEQAYTITIRDNGAGFSSAHRKKESNHESLSMKLNDERLSLLSKSLKRPFSITASDVTDLSGKICGTVVTILLPHDIPAL